MDRKNKPKSLEECVKIHEKLVYYIADKYKRMATRPNLDIDDLVQMAYMGLIKAYNTYDPDKGAAFGTHAANHMRWELSREINRYGAVVKPNINTSSAVGQVMDFMDKHYAKHGVKPNIDDMPYKTRAEQLRNIDAWRFLTTASRVSDLDRPLTPGESSTLSEVIADPNATMADDPKGHLMREVKKYLSYLGEREKYIMERYLGLNGEPGTFRSIGKELGISRSRVQQIYVPTLDWLKKQLGA